ncbi:MAG: metallophosphoesterase [Prevotella koreensis]|uniref:metallophosphoesterase n=1 Tax=Prevotella koreensis TaxID=2490854 RepID=UPI003F9FC0EA
MAVSKQEALGIISDINQAREPGSVTNRMVAVVLNYLAESLLTGNSVEDLAGLKNRMGNAEAKLATMENTNLPEIRSALSLLNSAVNGNDGLANRLTQLKNSLDTLTNGDTSDVIESFNEVVAFLGGVKDDETLQGILIEIDEKIKTLNASAMAYNTVRFHGIEKANVTFENSSLQNNPLASKVVWCEQAKTFALHADGKYYNSWGERSLYIDESTSMPYTSKQYILGEDIYMYDGASLNKMGGVVSDYLLGDVRVLSEGDNYASDDAVSTSNGKLRRMIMDVEPLTLTKIREVGNIVTHGGKTYSFKKPIGVFKDDVEYQNGDYALKDGVINIRIYNSWTPISIDDMAADTALLESKDVEWLEANATEQNTALRDLMNAPKEVIIDINNRLNVVKTGYYIANGEEISFGGGAITSPIRLLVGDVITVVVTNMRKYNVFDIISKVDENGNYHPLCKIVTVKDEKITITYTAQEDCNVVFSFNNSITVGNNVNFFISRRSKGDEWFKLNHKRYYNNWLYSSSISKTPVVGEKFDYYGVSSAGDVSLTKRQLITCKGGDRFVFNGNKQGWFVLGKDDLVIKGCASMLSPSITNYEIEIPEGGKYLVVYGKNDEKINVYKKVSSEIESKEIIDEDISYTHPFIGRYSCVIPDIGEKFTQKILAYGSICHVIPVIGGEEYSLTAWLKESFFGGYAILNYNMVVIEKVKIKTQEYTCGEIIKIPKGACFLIYNTTRYENHYNNKLVRIKRGDSIIDVNRSKDGFLVNMQAKQRNENIIKRLTFAWITDTHKDVRNYRRFIEYINCNKMFIDAALHTGDMNYTADSDNGFSDTVMKYIPEIPFMPTLGNHDALGFSRKGTALTSGSKKWNGSKYIKPFMDNKCVCGDDNCYYYRDFEEQKIRVIVVNDYDKPRWADGRWITVTDEAEKARSVEWIKGTSYEVGTVVHYKGLYLKCNIAGILDNDVHIWPCDNAPIMKTPGLCRYFTQEQVAFIVNAMNVSSGWSIIFAGHQTLESVENGADIANTQWHCSKTIKHSFGQNGYILQDLITSYIKRETLQKTYECITPTANPTGSVVRTNLPDFYPDVVVNADFSGAKGDVICFLHGHQHSDTCYYSKFCDGLKFLTIGLTTGCASPNCNTANGTMSTVWAHDDIARGSDTTRDCFNIISFDTEEKAVYLLRIGADINENFVKRDIARVSYAHK